MSFHQLAALLPLCALVSVVSCRQPSVDPLSEEERQLILSQGETMRVLTVEDSLDLAVLRARSVDLSARDIASATYAALARKMLATVTSPEQDGVGIAAPQVGLNRRVIAVQRFDKPGEPFEVYPNVRITAVHGEPELGAEGCLSVPGRRGNVMRWRHVDVAYTSPRSLKDTTESIHGFTAVIFQHECDHLDGVLYTDKLEGSDQFAE
ncbi:MAG: peptide deformylase [Bacteroidales bacterium]|nr:peptide deformylase [Bacteroidales bacterium]